MENRLTAQQLKNSILQMAVQGKLVPQDPNDEPASVLIEKIRKEKEQLIKEGKIKKNKKESYIFRGADNLHYEQVSKDVRCIEDELPFEIPESWEWCRLENIFQLINGDRGKNYPSKNKLFNSGEIPFISAINIQNNTVSFNDLLYLSSEQYDLLNSGKLRRNDFVFCLRGSLGKWCKYPFEKGAIASSLVILRKYKEIADGYIEIILNSPLITSMINKTNNGTAQPNLGARDIANYSIPIPPLNEQYRIIKQIKNIEPLIQKYQKAEEQLFELNSSIKEQLKKSILQYAIEGKLVPQDPNDEPASVLLERIRKEKQKLIAEGKIKKDKNESIIYRRDNSYYEKLDTKVKCIDDKLPFEIPNNWCWSRLGICLNVRDGTHDTPKYVSNGIPLVTSKNLCNGRIDFSTAKFISEKDHIAISQRSGVDPGDIMYAMIGSIGNPVLYDGNDKFSIKNMALFKNINKQLDMTYIYWFLYLSQDTMKKNASGAVQSFVSLTYLRKYLLPIPPLNEQNKIVNRIQKLEYLFSKLTFK